MVPPWEYLSNAEMPLASTDDGRTVVHINFAFCALAAEMISYLDLQDPELAVGLRKLIEARDCFIRSGSKYD